MSNYATKEQLIEIVGDMAAKINEQGGGGGGGATPLGASCYYATPRWLRFNPLNKRGLIIKANTAIRKPNGNYAIFTTDTSVDLSSYLLEPGKEYFVYLGNDSAIVASTTENANLTKIGRVHTLCVDAGTNLSMIAPASPASGLAAGDSFLIKGYSQRTDADFYAFYNKEISSVDANSEYYDVVTLPHPLEGFVAGDILPESVFCLSFHPECLVEDGMVYDKDTDIAVDIYLQSGTADNTRSAYNAVHTVNRAPINHMEDMRAVGKMLIRDNEFTSAALGSNECTNIFGSADQTYVGGHRDTANRRMISAIGCEEMCGYLWQWCADLLSGGSNWGTRDGRGYFGQEYGDMGVLYAGGAWGGGSCCGSRCRDASDVRSARGTYCGGRGSSRVTRVA